MTDEKWVVVDEVSGSFQAEILRGLLEAQEIQVMLSQEGIGHVYSLTVATLGRVQLLVPIGDVQRARMVLDDYYSGKFENQPPPDSQAPENNEPDP